MEAGDTAPVLAYRTTWAQLVLDFELSTGCRVERTAGHAIPWGAKAEVLHGAVKAMVNIANGAGSFKRIFMSMQRVGALLGVRAAPCARVRSGH